MKRNTSWGGLRGGLDHGSVKNPNGLRLPTALEQDEDHVTSIKFIVDDHFRRFFGFRFEFPTRFPSDILREHLESCFTRLKISSEDFELRLERRLDGSDIYALDGVFKVLGELVQNDSRLKGLLQLSGGSSVFDTPTGRTRIPGSRRGPH